MNLRRLAALIIALCMVLTTFAACGRPLEEPLPQPENTIDPAITGVPEESSEPETTTEPITTPEPTTTPEETTVPEETTAVTTTAATTASTTKKTSKDDYTVEDIDDTTMYATMSLNVRKGPSTDFDRIGALNEGEAVTVTGRASTGWYQVSFKGQTGYVSNLYMSATPVAATTKATTTTAAPDEDFESEELDEPGVTKAPSSTNTPTTTVSNTSGSVGGAWVTDNAVGYMYNSITQDKYKKALDKLADAVKMLAPKVSLDEYLTHDEAYDIASKMAQMVATGYCYFDGVTQISSNGATLTLKYYVDNLNDANRMVNELNAVADRVVNTVSGYSEYNKVKYIYEWLCRNTVYGESYGASTYGPLVNGTATCLGYAKGTFYLLSKAGFDVVYVVGLGNEADHAWVKVKIGGKWYNIDTTWGDPDGNAQKLDPSYLMYDFLCVTDTYMKNTRRAVYDLSTYYNMPSATSNELNWFVLNGNYVDTVDQAIEAFKKQIKEAAKDTTTKYKYVAVQFSNEAEFAKWIELYDSSKDFQSAVVKNVTSARKAANRYHDAKKDYKRTLTIMYRLDLA